MQSLRTLHPCAPALCILLSANALYAVPPAGTAWVPIPEATDEFDGASLDTAKWQDFHSYWTGRAPSYFHRPNVSVDGGNLRLKTTPDPLHLDSIRAACVQSRARSLAYGYYEARIKASDISMTSSFWFQGKYSEMDVIENIGNPTKAGEEQVAYRMNMNTHYYPNGWETDEANPKYHTLPTRVADANHIYAMEWDESFIRYYLDGVRVYEQANGGRFTEGQTLFLDTEAFVWQGYPTRASLMDDTKNTMYVDWVRAWKKAAVGLRPMGGAAQDAAAPWGMAPGRTYNRSNRVFTGPWGFRNLLGIRMPGNR